MDVVGEAVEQGAGEALAAEDVGPFVEGEIAGDEGGSALVALREDFERPVLGSPRILTPIRVALWKTQKLLSVSRSALDLHHFESGTKPSSSMIRSWTLARLFW